VDGDSIYHKGFMLGSRGIMHVRLFRHYLGTCEVLNEHSLI
jgi:hypothetical protein